MRRSLFGDIVLDCWKGLPRHYPQLIPDAFIVMPNHVHGILAWVDHSVGTSLETRPCQPLTEIVRGFKTYSARQINHVRGMQNAPVWQRNYYEHIVRNERELQAIRDYIVNNPYGWEKDPDNMPLRSS